VALCKFVVSLANILFIVHFKGSSETRSVLTVVPNYTTRLLRGFEFRPDFLRIPHNEPHLSLPPEKKVNK